MPNNTNPTAATIRSWSGGGGGGSPPNRKALPKAKPKETPKPSKPQPKKERVAVSNRPRVPQKTYWAGPNGQRVEVGKATPEQIGEMRYKSLKAQHYTDEAARRIASATLQDMGYTPTQKYAPTSLRKQAESTTEMTPSGPISTINPKKGALVQDTFAGFPIGEPYHEPFRFGLKTEPSKAIMPLTTRRKDKVLSPATLDKAAKELQKQADRFAREQAHYEYEQAIYQQMGASFNPRNERDYNAGVAELKAQYNKLKSKETDLLVKGGGLKAASKILTKEQNKYNAVANTYSKGGITTKQAIKAGLIDVPKKFGSRVGLGVQMATEKTNEMLPKPKWMPEPVYEYGTGFVGGALLGGASTVAFAARGIESGGASVVPELAATAAFAGEHPAYFAGGMVGAWFAGKAIRNPKGLYSSTKTLLVGKSSLIKVPSIKGMQIGLEWANKKNWAAYGKWVSRTASKKVSRGGFVGRTGGDWVGGWTKSTKPVVTYATSPWENTGWAGRVSKQYGLEAMGKASFRSFTHHVFPTGRVSISYASVGGSMVPLDYAPSVLSSTLRSFRESARGGVWKARIGGSAAVWESTKLPKNAFKAIRGMGSRGYVATGLTATKTAFRTGSGFAAEASSLKPSLGIGSSSWLAAGLLIGGRRGTKGKNRQIPVVKFGESWAILKLPTRKKDKRDSPIFGELWGTNLGIRQATGKDFEFSFAKVRTPRTKTKTQTRTMPPITIGGGGWEPPQKTKTKPIISGGWDSVGSWKLPKAKKRGKKKKKRGLFEAIALRPLFSTKSRSIFAPQTKRNVKKARVGLTNILVYQGIAKKRRKSARKK